MSCGVTCTPGVFVGIGQTNASVIVIVPVSPGPVTVVVTPGTEIVVVNVVETPG